MERKFAYTQQQVMKAAKKANMPLVKRSEG
jgi:hypothetical protein